MQVKVIKTEGIDLIEVKNDSSLVLTLANLGASIYSIYFDNKIMTVTPESVSEWKLPYLYFGKTVGPVPNRIKDGKLKINGIEYQMERNEGNNTLHSGSKGYSNIIFDYKIEEKPDKILVHFFTTQNDMENGLPGTIKTSITYKIFKARNSFDILMNASSDKDTIFGLTNHSYFSLGDQDLRNLFLSVPSNKKIEIDRKNMLPTSVSESKKYFSFAKINEVLQYFCNEAIYKKLNEGYDNCYLLNNKENVIKLKNEKYLMTMITNFDCCQIYSDNFKDDIPMINTPKQSHRGFALEPEDNILNRPLLKAGKTYSKFIKYSFKKL